MTEQKHTPGPLRVDSEWLGDIQTVKGEEIATVFNSRHVGEELVIQGIIPWTREQQTANARLLAASYNAFDSAAARLGLNAVELAERMQDGGIADLVEALEASRVWIKECAPETHFSHERVCDGKAVKLTLIADVFSTLGIKRQ